MIKRVSATKRFRVDDGNINGTIERVLEDINKELRKLTVYRVVSVQEEKDYQNGLATVVVYLFAPD